MGEYNKSIEELLEEFQDQQISEMVKQVNTQLGVPTRSIGSNNLNHKPGESSIPPHLRESYKPKAKGRKYYNMDKQKPMINEEFKPKNSLIQEPVPSFRYFLNIDCVTDKRKSLDMWKAAMILNLIYEPAYAEEDRDVNAIYNLIINSF